MDVPDRIELCLREFLEQEFAENVEFNTIKKLLIDRTDFCIANYKNLGIKLEFFGKQNEKFSIANFITNSHRLNTEQLQNPKNIITQIKFSWRNSDFSCKLFFYVYLGLDCRNKYDNQLELPFFNLKGDRPVPLVPFSHCLKSQIIQAKISNLLFKYFNNKTIFCFGVIWTISSAIADSYDCLSWLVSIARTAYFSSFGLFSLGLLIHLFTCWGDSGLNTVYDNLKASLRNIIVISNTSHLEKEIALTYVKLTNTHKLPTHLNHEVISLLYGEKVELNQTYVKCFNFNFNYDKYKRKLPVLAAKNEVTSISNNAVVTIDEDRPLLLVS